MDLSGAEREFNNDHIEELADSKQVLKNYSFLSIRMELWFWLVD